MHKYKEYLAGLLVGLIFFIVGLVTLSDYGTDWDTINHLPRGQAYLRYILSGEKTYDKLPDYVEYHQKDGSLLFSPSKNPELIPKRSLYQIDGYGASYFLAKDGGHPPLSDILSSIFNVVLFQQLSFINDIDSYHVYIIFVASLLVGTLFWWTKKHYGTFTALIAVLSLTLYPLFFGESHFNIKDIPQASFYSLMIIFLYEGIIAKKNSLLILSAIFFGFSLGTKFNILFSPFIILPWIIIYLKQSYTSLHKISWLIPSIIYFPLIAILIFWGSWPYLWTDPIHRFLSIIKYYTTIGINPNFDPSFIFLGFNTYATQWILYTTPLVILFLTFFGVVYVLTKGWKEKEKTSILIFIWLLIPILRVTVPHAGIYGGVRQIMEFIPAMAILAGIGANFFLKQVSSIRYQVLGIKAANKKHFMLYTLYFILILSFLPIFFKFISIHPNENAYFNPLIGGLKGARDMDFPYWGNTFGNAYRQGSNFVNKQAERNATLVLSQELMPNLPRTFVREDITFSNTMRSGYLRKGEYVIGLNFGSGLNMSYYSSRFYNRTLLPIHEVKIDNTAILTVWKNDIEHTKKNYKREEKLENIPYTIVENGIKILFDKVTTLSRIKWEFEQKECSGLDTAYFEVSTDGKNWKRVPHVLPADIPIPVLPTQPNENSIEFPFGAEKAIAVFVRVEPKDACMKKVKNVTTYYYPDAI